LGDRQATERGARSVARRRPNAAGDYSQCSLSSPLVGVLRVEKLPQATGTYIETKTKNKMDTTKLKFDAAGLIPAIVQDSATGVVLMQAYMNRESIARTEAEGRVCFFSRSRGELWTKGETSGNYLYFKEMLVDCDGDCLLVKAQPAGPACHTGADTCWSERNRPAGFLFYLEEFLRRRKDDPAEESYTARLMSRGINKIAQKVGEEAVELIIEAKDANDDLFLGEAADLMYHYLVLLMARGYSLDDVAEVLRGRHK
jgi:phosphoribosyl-ATP pyrophosphohydrolase/phosphoribosyl-AMP cyclohydrolase